MSILFGVISGALFSLTSLWVIALPQDSSPDKYRDIALLFIASGVFAIAGVLA